MAVKRDNPYAAFNFEVDLGDGQVAGFSEVSGLSIALETIAYREGSDRVNMVRRLPGLARVSDVTLKRGVVGNLDLYAWLKDGLNGQAQRRHVTVRLLTEDRSAVAVTWKLAGAFPVKLSHGPLTAASDMIAVEELVLAADSLEIE
jgi:phage tail-like protein